MQKTVCRGCYHPEEVHNVNGKGECGCGCIAWSPSTSRHVMRGRGRGSLASVCS